MLRPSVRHLCQVPGGPTSGFYGWQRRQQPAARPAHAHAGQPGLGVGITGWPLANGGGASLCAFQAGCARHVVGWDDAGTTRSRGPYPGCCSHRPVPRAGWPMPNAAGRTGATPTPLCTTGGALPASARHRLRQCPGRKPVVSAQNADARTARVARLGQCGLARPSRRSGYRARGSGAGPGLRSVWARTSPGWGGARCRPRGMRAARGVRTQGRLSSWGQLRHGQRVLVSCSACVSHLSLKYVALLFHPSHLQTV